MPPVRNVASNVPARRRILALSEGVGLKNYYTEIQTGIQTTHHPQLSPTVTHQILVLTRFWCMRVPVRASWPTHPHLQKIRIHVHVQYY